MPGIVVVNGAALSDDELGELRRLFTAHRIVECAPGDVGDEVGAALEQAPDFVAVAGGDGTIRTAAEQMRDQRVPLLPVPGGTRNHFAKDVGVDTFDVAAEVAEAGQPRKVDLGDVNGLCFVNNSSIGLYPRMVLAREAREHRMPKWRANLHAAWEQLRHGRRIRVEVDGVSQWAWMAWVGNGCYGEELSTLAERSALDENVLDIRIVRADRSLSRIRVVGALLFGRLGLSPVVRLSQSRRVVLDVDRDEVEVALDGEVERLRTPLVYTSSAGGLVVLAPG